MLSSVAAVSSAPPALPAGSTFAIPVQVDPYGLVLDSTGQHLYVADGRSGGIVRVNRDDHDIVARVPAGGVAERHRIGGLAIARDGSIYASRLGYGRAGTLMRFAREGAEPEELPGLQAHVWRAGLAYSATEHVLYVSQFVEAAAGRFTGSILEVDLADGASSLVAAGFTQPVAVARVGTDLVVADAGARAVYVIRMHGGRAIAIRELASDLGRPVACCAFDGGSALVATYDEASKLGAVHCIDLGCGVRTLLSGSWSPRGIATDGTRVFVALPSGLVVTALTGTLDDV